jgi:HEAT repeat protein
MLPALLGTAGCDSINRDISDFMSSLSPTSPSEAARNMLDPNDPDKRREGTLLISNSTFGGVDVYVDSYRDAVTYEQNPLVKAAAIRALAKHGRPDDARLIAAQLTDENPQVQWEAARGLQRLHEPAVVPALLSALEEKSMIEIAQGEQTAPPDVRIEAAIALGQYPEDRVFQGLVAALQARELAINLAASQSLWQITGQELGSDARAWLMWYSRADGDPFANKVDYEFPVYTRDRSWYEQLAFWYQPVVEHPAPPTGLVPSTERRTYEDVDSSDPDADDQAAP